MGLGRLRLFSVCLMNGGRQNETVTGLRIFITCFMIGAP